MRIRRLAVIAWNQRKEPSHDEHWNEQNGCGSRAEWAALTEIASSLLGPEQSRNCHKLTAAEVWAAGHTIEYSRTLGCTE